MFFSLLCLMAIEKNSHKVLRHDSEFSPGSRGSMSSEDGELQRGSSATESDEDEFDDADSGAGSDDFDLLELGEAGAEFCQIGDQSCTVPFELYDLPDLQDILSLDVWNDSLSEEERFSLIRYLPDMDQYSFMHTLKELFSGCNFHFGCPITTLFDMLKGGFCEPRVALYRQALNYFQRRQHYHLLRMHQNNMVSSLYQIRDAWQNCKGYSIEERLRVLNIVRSQNSLMYEKMEDLGPESGSSEKEESGDVLWSKRVKDNRRTPKVGRFPAYVGSPTSGFPSRVMSTALEPVKYRKKDPKGLLKLAGSKAPLLKEIPGGHAHAYENLEMNGPYNSRLAVPRKNKATRYDSGAVLRLRDQLRSSDDPEGATYEVPVHNALHGRAVDRSGVLKLGKKHERSGVSDFASDSSLGFSKAPKDVFTASGRSKSASMKPEIKAFPTKVTNRTLHPYSKRIKYPEDFQQSVVDQQIMPTKGRAEHSSLKRNEVDVVDETEPFWRRKMQEDPYSTDQSFKYDDWGIKPKKWKNGNGSPDLKLNSYKNSSTQINNKVFHSGYGTKFPEENGCGNSKNTGGPDMGGPNGITMFLEDEETESGSSEPDDEKEDHAVSMRSKLGQASNAFEGRSSLGKPIPDSKRVKSRLSSHQGKKEPDLDGNMHTSRRSVFEEDVNMQEAGKYFSKAKQKGKMRKATWEKNCQVQVDADEMMPISSMQAYSADRRKRTDYTVHQSNNFFDYVGDDEDDSLETQLLADDVGASARVGKKGKNTKAYEDDQYERSDVRLLGFDSLTKKRKSNIDVACRNGADECDLHSNTKQQTDETFSLKKRKKLKPEATTDGLYIETLEPPVTEIGAIDEPEIKPLKKTFTPITPTVHTGFSFSVIHLLSAVRLAMVTPHSEDLLAVGNHVENVGINKFGDDLYKNEGINGVHSNVGAYMNNSDKSNQSNAPCLTVLEIVNRVRSNPGDPCILEMQEPLQDLVRGVLKIFSSKTAPLGAKGWKTLILYEKSTKSWSWIGPLSHSTSDHETIEEVTSPEAWGLPHKMLVKLVDAFANWLKSGQETLQQIGSLPAPPVTLTQFNLDEKERFKDLRAQKSLNTISPSSEEVRDYFRREELLRYSIPDRAFAYTAVDGRKSIVAPLRRCGGKPTSKAREHFMLKQDRPPHVTILCLVRDAAARLPGSIGTRADVCTLIRDSQYIVEDIPDAQVNQIVSGALDRLHYERDPCVQFDGERKLWVYLHREREEEDFEDDGTSSTKKWKRQKKDATEQFDQETTNVAFQGTGERITGGSALGFDLTADLNVEPLCLDDDNRVGLAYNDARNNMGNDENTHGADQGASNQGNPTVWEALGLNPLRESNLLCQENSTNEDFDDGAEKPVAFFNAGLL